MVVPSTSTLEEGPVTSRSRPAVVQLDGVSHLFKSAEGVHVEAIQDLSLAVGTGEFVAIVGPSGCGKTTLLNIVSGLETPSTGEVLVNGHRPRSGDRDVGYLFARDALLPWRTVLANVELPLALYGVGKAERRERARVALADVGLEHFTAALPAELSQGMRQRAAIARTLAANPSLMLLDEPFSALDAQTKLLLQDSFSSLWSQISSTVVLITHDLGEAIALADRVVLMTRRPGRIKNVFDVNLPRPRSVLSLQGNDAYHKMYERIWAELREEVA